MKTLERQLADYGEFQRELHSPVTPNELTVRFEQPDRVLGPSRRPPRWVYVVAAAVAIAALVGGVAWLTGDGTEDDVINQTTITTLSETTETSVPITEDPLTVTDVIDIGFPIVPSIWGADRVLAAGDAIWVGIDSWDRTEVVASPLFRIDPATREVTGELTLPGQVIDLAADSGNLWALLADDTVVRIRIATREVTATVDLSLGFDEKDPSRSDLIVAGGGLWIAGATMPGFEDSAGAIARVDLETLALEVLHRPSGDLPATMWVGEHAGVVWGLDSHNKVLVGYDLSTYEVTSRKVQPQDGESFAVLGEDAIWVTGDGLTRFDLNSRSTSTIHQQGGGAIVLADGGLWEATAGNDDVTDAQVRRYDQRSGVVTDTVDGSTGWVHSMIATSDGSIWLSTTTGHLTRINTTTREVVEKIEVGTTGDLLAHEGAIWIASEDGTLIRVGHR